MIERRGLLRFPQKPAAIVLILLQLRRHALDGDHAFQFGILRLIDLTHAANAEQSHDRKASSNRAR